MKRFRLQQVLLIICVGTASLFAAGVADLKSDDPVARATAAWKLGVTGDRTVVAQLMPLLDDQTPYVVLAALVALGDIGDESAVPGIEKAVGHANFAVRTAAIAQLGRIGGKLAAVKLMAIYKAPKGKTPKERAQEQLIAVRALKSCPDPKVVDSLIASEMGKADVSDAAKGEMCICAGLTGDQKHGAMLKEHVKGESILVLCGASEGLAYLGDNAGIDELVRRLPEIKSFNDARPIRYTLKQLTKKPFWHAKHWAGWWKEARTTFRAKRPSDEK